MKESIEPFVSRSVLVLSQDTSANTAARALHERRIGSAVVSDKSGHIVGIVTDRDLSTQILGFDLPAQTPLSEIMTTDILTIPKTAKMSDVVRIMEVNGVRRIPVVVKTEKGKDKCVGMVTLDDLLASRSLTPDSISKIVKNQMYRNFHRIHHTDRSENRKEQKLNRFNKVMADFMDISRPLSERVGFFLLKQIVQRLSYTEAAHFISQLPKLFHEDLLGLPAGPNTKITGDTIISDLTEGFQLTRSEAIDLLRNFWAALGKAMNPENPPPRRRPIAARFARFFGTGFEEPINLSQFTFDRRSQLEEWP